MSIKDVGGLCKLVRVGADPISLAVRYWQVLSSPDRIWIRIALTALIYVRVSSVLCCPVHIQALQLADSPPKESY
jgi:hypothetical protein